MSKRRIQDSDDSSDGEDNPKVTKLATSESHTSDSDSEWNTNGKNKRIKKEKRSKPKIEDDSDSDSEASDAFDDGWGDDLIGDEKDREEIEAMTEMEREQVLFARGERRDAERKRWEIEKRIKQRNREKKKDDDGDDESQPSKYRDKSSSPEPSDPALARARNQKREQSSALGRLKEQREQKEKRAKEGSSKSGPLNVGDYFSSDSEEEDEEGNLASSDSDSDDDRRRSSDDDKEDEELARKRKKVECKEELKPAKMSRFRLCQWMHMPWFRNTIVGTYVRVSIGLGDESGARYRIAEIKDTGESSKTYKLDPGDPKATKIHTNKTLLLRIGSSDRAFRMCFISNSDWSDTEFDFWKKHGLKAGLPTIGDIEKKQKELERMKKHVITDREVETMVKEKAKHRTNPINFALQKTTLLKMRDAAETAGNIEEVASIQSKLEEIEKRANKLSRDRQAGIAGITEINERSRRKIRGMESVCEAEWAKFRNNDKVDPFTRRTTAPILVSNTTQDNKVQIKNLLAERYTTDIDMHYESLTFSGRESKENKEAGEEEKKKDEIAPDDIYSAHDFDIDLDIDLPTSSFPSATYPPV